MKTLYRNHTALVVFLAPAVLLVALLVFFPVLLNVYYSLFKWTAYSADMKFVGMKYYAKLFRDPKIALAIKNNTMYAVVSLIFQTGLGLIIAHLFVTFANTKYAAITRVVIFIPAVISLTAIGLLWVIAYNPSLGFVNAILERIGLGALTHDWLGDAKTAMMSIIMVSQWQYIGEMVMLYTVGLQAVPTDIYESAKIDGASNWQTFLHVTVPMIKSTILLTLSSGFLP